MINKLKILLAMLVASPFLCLAPVLADTSNPLNAACQTNAATRASAVCQQSQSQGSTNPIAGKDGIISKGANIIALITGIAAVIVIIISGFMFVTAGGAAPGQRSADPNRLKTARSALSGAIIGLVVVALAWAIVRFVTDKVIG